MLQPIRSQAEYESEYQKSVDDPEGFWAEKADAFRWRKKWEHVLQWDFEKPDVKWFLGGKLNITENILDRHLEQRPNKTAILWEPNEPHEEVRRISYKELYEESNRFANVLREQGVAKGDRVCIYMPMVPELPIAVLACARIGAVHSVVFAGFSSKALADRINDSECKVLLTADGAFRGDKQTPLKDMSDEALPSCPSIEKCIVLQRTKANVNMKEGRDIWWHEAIKDKSPECEAEEMDAEDTLFILYTSGSTGKPKGIVHTTAGYMIYTAYTFRNVFQYEEDDVYWCTADIGWITGHSYIIYGPLLEGATSLIFEGVPTYPNPGRFWQVVDKHQVNQFYTAPTAIRALQSQGDEFIEPYELSSLKVLGTVGEPINEEAWDWYHKKIGKGRCPIVDTWWQTETGGIMISPLPGIHVQKPTFAMQPLPGVFPALLDNDKNELGEDPAEGNLCVKFPWPGILRTTWGDHERCRKTYFETFKGYYFSGDGCKRDEQGNYRITGRVDDVINVSGHRFGTAEIEDAIDQHEDVVETAVVGFPHDIKGQGIHAYIIPNDEVQDMDRFKKEVTEVVNEHIGPIAKPDRIQVVKGLPKTRSGKIMRRILRKVAEGDTSNLGDTSTLLDPTVVEEIKEGAPEAP
ncbi:MAG: acetate--CoA ligase [Flavobacteriales bacterium]